MKLVETYAQTPVADDSPLHAERSMIMQALLENPKRSNLLVGMADNESGSDSESGSSSDQQLPPQSTVSSFFNDSLSVLDVGPYTPLSQNQALIGPMCSCKRPKIFKTIDCTAYYWASAEVNFTVKTSTCTVTRTTDESDDDDVISFGICDPNFENRVCLDPFGVVSVGPTQVLDIQIFSMFNLMRSEKGKISDTLFYRIAQSNACLHSVPHFPSQKMVMKGWFNVLRMTVDEHGDEISPATCTCVVDRRLDGSCANGVCDASDTGSGRCAAGPEDDDSPPSSLFDPKLPLWSRIDQDVRGGNNRFARHIRFCLIFFLQCVHSCCCI